MKNERGFTLVELLVVTAITGIIVTVLGTAIYQLSTVSEYGDARLTALHELQNAAYWFNLDGQMAVSATGGAGLSLTLPSSALITYTLAGTSLTRTAGASSITLAQNITTASFSVSGSVITMALTSNPPGRNPVNEQGTYNVSMRPVPE
jgi:prepilin-type N-terminal cleavage/methylation domain-containing protein